MTRNPPRSASKVLAALPRAVSAGRTFTTSVLGVWGLSHLSDTAELLVSELITNVVKHAGGFATLGLSVRDALLVQVWDVGSTPPIRRAPADDDIGGRGLELVDLLAKEWGCDILTAGGKIVWFALDLDVHDVA
jgi:anti-sigma regulatory factor (Ser/Thr protein kinase)